MTETNKFVAGFAVGAVFVAVIAFVVSPSESAQNKNPKDDLANIAAAVESKKMADSNRVDVSEDGHFRGNSNAPIVIVEFSDYQCPYCAKFNATMKDIANAYPSEVKWVHKQFPLGSHSYARMAAEASECAGEQNKFWEYSDALFNRQAEIGDDFLDKLAKEFDLDMNKFDECVESGKYADKVEADYQEGIRVGVKGTPAWFLNGAPLKGAISFQQIETKINALLN